MTMEIAPIKVLLLHNNNNNNHSITPIHLLLLRNSPWLSVGPAKQTLRLF